MSSSFALNRRARVLLASVSTATLLAGGGFVHGLGVLNAGASLDAPVRTAQASFGTVSIEQVVARPDQLVQVRVSLNNQGERAIDIRPSMFRLYATGSEQPIPAQPVVWLEDASVSPHEGRTVSVNFVLAPGEQASQIEIDDAGRAPVVLAAIPGLGGPTHG